MTTLKSGIPFKVRGVGTGRSVCLLCGDPGRGNNSELAAFVQGREGGEAAVRAIRDAGLIGRLDYRPHEPEWVQVKLGGCAEHADVLDNIFTTCKDNGGWISTAALVAAAGIEVTDMTGVRPGNWKGPEVPERLVAVRPVDGPFGVVFFRAYYGEVKTATAFTFISEGQPLTAQRLHDFHCQFHDEPFVHVSLGHAALAYDRMVNPDGYR